MFRFLSSRVGRRLVFLFVICALLPLLGLATLSYSAISEYLVESSFDELRAGSKAYGMSLMDRLQLLEAALLETSMLLDNGELRSPRRALLSRQFEWIGVVQPGEAPRTLVGSPDAAPSVEDLGRLPTTETRMSIATNPRLVLGVDYRSADGRAGVLAGLPIREFLWWGSVGDNTLPASTDMLVVADGEVLLATQAVESDQVYELAASISSESSEEYAQSWDPHENGAVSGYWTLPLSLRFDSTDWIIAWSRPAADVLLPVRQFAGPFVLVLTATFLSVILLALSQIRRFLQPLEQLRVGTQRVAAQDFSTPVSVTSQDEFEDLAASFNRMTQRLGGVIGELQRHQLGTLRSLARTMDERSPWTLGHSGRVADLSKRMGEVMGIPDQEITALYRAGLLHDIGKLRLPTELLEKASDLSPAEFVQIQEHVEAGVRILAPIPEYASVTPIVAQHHERLNGTGYPRGLVGDEIVLGARILAVADSFDALSSDRPYRSRLTRTEVLAELHSGAGTLYDPEVLAALDVVLGSDRPRVAESLRTSA